VTSNNVTRDYKMNHYSGKTLNFITEVIYRRLWSSGPGFGQAQKSGGVKPANEISDPPLLISRCSAVK
jgi:hypothetical protein